MAKGVAIEGAVSLVTGGGSGIGAAIVEGLAAKGAKVGVIDRDVGTAQAMADRIMASGGEAIALAADVSDSAAITTAIDAVAARWGRLDIAVNNAGIGGGQRGFEDIDDDLFDACVAVNLRGVFLSMRRELTIMREQKQGVIVNIASALGLIGHANSANYVATKHAVIGLTRCAAIQYGEHGVRVNALCPGVIETPLLARSEHPDAVLAKLRAHSVFDRLGTPEEVAQATVWLASPAASFVTGTTLAVDGGWTAR